MDQFSDINLIFLGDVTRDDSQHVIYDNSISINYYFAGANQRAWDECQARIGFWDCSL